MLHRSRLLVAFCTLTMAGSLSAQQQARVAAHRHDHAATHAHSVDGTLPETDPKPYATASMGAGFSSATAAGARRRPIASDASSVAMQNAAHARPTMIPPITSDG